MSTLTIRLDERIEGDLREVVACTGSRRADFAREALRRQIALAKLELLRRKLAPYAQTAAGRPKTTSSARSHDHADGSPLVSTAQRGIHRLRSIVRDPWTNGLFPTGLVDTSLARSGCS